MLRNLNKTRDGKRILGTPYVGVLGSAVPTAGPPYALARNDVVFNSLQSNYVRVWVTSFTFPAGFFVEEDTRWTAPTLSDGTYVANGYLIVDDVDVDGPTPGQPYPLLTLTEGSTPFTATAALGITVTPNMLASAILTAAISVVASLGITTTPNLAATVTSSQFISVGMVAGITTTPDLAAGVFIGELLTATVDVSIATTPELAVFASVGLAIPEFVAPTRIAAVDLDGDHTVAAAVFIKDPQATLDYGLDIRDWLADAGDELLTFNVQPLVGGTCVAEATGLADGVMAVLASGGTPGGLEGLLFDFYTLGGRHDQRTIFLQIQER